MPSRLVGQISLSSSKLQTVEGCWLPNAKLFVCLDLLSTKLVHMSEGMNLAPVRADL